MSVKQFKFVSPGIFINEIDRSTTAETPGAIGPVIIGRTERGPAFRPTQIESFSDYLQVFGEPVAGGGADDDQWRNGVPIAPTYASYAAQAYLRNNGPVTVVNVLGSASPGATTAGKAGWKVGTATTTMGANTDGGAYGLFLFSSGTHGNTPGVTSVTGTLAAVWYCTEGCIALSGNLRGTEEAMSGTSVMISSDASGLFTAVVKDSSNNDLQKSTFSFNADDDRYIRKVFNTDPTLTNTDITVDDAEKKYWLGQSYDRAALDNITEEEAAGTSAMILGLHDGTYTGADFRLSSRAAQSGWVISQDMRSTAGNTSADRNTLNAQSFDPEGTDVTKLFKFHTLSDGDWEQRNLKISIEKIKASPNNINKYGSFSVVIRRIEDNDKNVVVVERYDNLSLNPNSSDYIASRIGDSYATWDNDRRRLQDYGTYPNQSKFVRVEMNNNVETGQTDPELLPFGFHGPIVHGSFTLDGSTGVKASGTITIDDAGQCLAGSTISVITTAGDTVTITGHATANAMSDTTGASSTGTFAAGTTTSGGSTNNATQATAIATTLNLHDDLTATATNAVVTITQNTAGTAGNTTITVADGSSGASMSSATTLVNFTNGINDEAPDLSYATLAGSSFVVGGSNIVNNFTGSANTVNIVMLGQEHESDLASGSALHAQFDFPSHQLRANSKQGTPRNHLEAYWGIDTTRSGTEATAFDRSNIDLAHALPANVATSFAAGTNQTTSYVFTLDNVSGSKDAPNTSDGTSGHTSKFVYVSGSRANGDSITAMSGTYRDLLKHYDDVGGARFTMPLFGGFQGLDITEREPFNDTRALPSTATEENSYAFHSLKKAIDMVSDPEYVEMNLATMPGIVNQNLTKHLIDTCEARGDALAIIDPRGGYSPSSEDATSEESRTSTTAAKDVSDNMKARNINSSYGAAYFPWVQVRDNIRGNLLFVPPSVIGLGVLGSSETKTAVWFAPAGFNRGGLTEGAAGLNVVGVRHKLTSDERDRLYENNINPIATFPAEGIVIFGQKTLQVSASALDRINVRRLLIFVKKGISRISSQILFQQNVESTWADFKYRADNFLSNVQAGLGLSEYKIVLDRSTTTPDLVDRNIMYAKIFLKPARSIEFIALDFIVTNAGASFED